MQYETGVTDLSKACINLDVNVIH